jgi:predicted porin
MKNISASHRYRGPWVAGALLPLLMAPAMAVDLATADGAWTFSIDGNVNADYVYTNCQSATSAKPVAGGLTCVGSANGNSVSSVDNGLLHAAFVFGVATTQDGIDITAHLGLYPGIDTHTGGDPNNANAGGNNTALGTGGLDVRQVYATFGNKDIGTVLVGRQIGLFGADVILNDMTLLGVGGPGGAASAAPGNTTLGGIGLGYIYTDWLAQINYTTPNFSGFNVTAGIFNPINSLTDAAPAGASLAGDTTLPKKAPGFHGKVTWTLPIADGTKFYASATFITQDQNYVHTDALGAATPFSYTGTGYDIFAKIDVQAFEAFGYYYHGSGLGTTGLFVLSDDGLGNKRDSDGYMAQVSYKFGPLKLGVNYGDSRLDQASGEVNPTLLRSNRKATGGLYYSVTKNLTLLGEYSNVKSEAQNGGTNTANTFNIGAFVGF